MIVPRLARQLTALALMVAALALPAAGMAGLWSAYRDNALAIEEERRTLGRLLAMINAAGDRDDASVDRDLFEDWFMGGQGPAHLTATLQTRVKSIAEATGVDVLQVGDLKPKTMDGITYAGIQLTMAGPIDALHQTLLAIETSKPLLFIEQAQLAANPVRDRGPSQPVFLTVELAVLAPTQPGPATPPDAQPR